MDKIKWNSTKEEDSIIEKIVERVSKTEVLNDPPSLIMDITAVHLNDVKLDLEKLLQFDDFNFWHDVFGIMKHIDRKTGKLMNHFLPRCSTN